MPALWQSSQRPMYVRTVWVDGFRHAILTQDDPYLLKLAKRRRPNSSASTIKTNPRLSHRENDFQRKIDLVVKSGKSIITKRPKSSHEPVEQLNLSDIEQDSDEELMLKASPQVLNESRRSFDMRNYRANRTARPDTKESTELSDRVLQWLDLAGKVDLLAPENAERMAQPRHSWPEIQRRHNFLKSKTAIDIRGKEGKISPKVCDIDSPKAQQNIDRHEFYVPTSANTIETYARQSRTVKITPRNEYQPKTMIKTKPNIKNVTETRQKVATERSAVQKQYAELVNKKLIPDVSKNAKKQVHIFIPELPKKPVANISTVSSRAESLLSNQSVKLLRQ